MMGRFLKCSIKNYLDTSVYHYNFIKSVILATDIIIIYHDFLPPPIRGIHGKSDNTHTIIQHTPLSPYT